MRKLYLTFDIEDFISKNSVWVIQRILEALRRYDLEAIFFITGHMAEELQKFDEVVDMLNEHQIGYHSSSHSVHPTIFEFTDVESYEQAYDVSLRRETTHINPLTGEVEGEGGILTLEKIFHRKQIKLFRAPGHCWTPPHLEALKTLGVTYDFSTNLGLIPVNFKGLTFYPYPIMGHWRGVVSDYRTLLTYLLRIKLAILTIHPSLLVNKNEWDSIYFTSNPKKLSPPIGRDLAEVRYLLRNFNLLLNQIARLKKFQIVDTTPKLEKSNSNLNVSEIDVERCYQRSMRWALKQKYKPKFLLHHFFKFFEIN